MKIFPNSLEEKKVYIEQKNIQTEKDEQLLMMLILLIFIVQNYIYVI
jgi:uncharacterized integral membrane protein